MTFTIVNREIPIVFDDSREKAFERFKKKPRAVLTNAFALQEGIDIKKVDSREVNAMKFNHPL